MFFMRTLALKGYNLLDTLSLWQLGACSAVLGFCSALESLRHQKVPPEILNYRRSSKYRNIFF